MRIEGTDIYMIRGDNESLTISMEDAQGNAIPFEEGDTVYMTVKKSTATQEKVMQKTATEFVDGKATFEIEPEDTKELSPYKYVYDIQLTKAEGEVRTLIKPSAFVVEPEVTYE